MTVHDVDGPWNLPVGETVCETCLRKAITPVLPYTEDGQAAINFTYAAGHVRMMYLFKFIKETRKALLRCFNTLR